MPDLRTFLPASEPRTSTTHVQSGNVIFKSDKGAGKLTEAIEKRIRRDLGLSVTVLLRTQPQLAKVLAGNPFAEDGKEPTKLHVTFLAEKPELVRTRELDPERAEHDEFHVVGQEIYLHCPNGYGRSKLTNAYFEKHLGVAATTRNWRTVTKLAELVSSRRS